MYGNVLSGALLALLLTGCGSGGDSGSKTAGAVLDISGSPAPAVANLPYHYQPDFKAGGVSVQFSASGLPGWASVDPATGAISGTPGPGDVTAYHPYTLTVQADKSSLAREQVLRVLPTEAYLAGGPALAFDATDYDGQPRKIRNDLSGGPLRGQVTFGQSHTMKPNSNFVRDTGDETRSVYKPKPVALRDALLLFTPDTPSTPVTVNVTAFLNGEPAGSFAMNHPNALPKSDHSGQRRVEYSTRAWSVRLPWNLMRNGLSLAFTVNRDAPDALTGRLAASGIDMDEASQIVFQSIRLGMLTPVEHNANHFTLNDPVMAATDYFQTLPVSKLVMGSYADMELDRGLIATPADINLEGEVIRSGNIRLSTILNEKGHLTVVTGAEGQPPATRWLMTARGSLHPVDQPWSCLVPSGGHLGLALCDPEERDQSWNYDNNSRLRNATSGQCVDYDYSVPRVLMYGCHGGGNQKWEGIRQTSSQALSLLPGKVLKTLFSTL
jgi:hypothetical protein